MKCQRCGIDLPGSRGAYRWRSEVVALGEDAHYPQGETENQAALRQRLLAELAQMKAEEIEADVYQLWEGVFCRYCRFELGRILQRFLDHR
jgi:hypothetical protein